MPGFGIDFGTTNSSVVLFDGHEFVDVVGVMPTALYLNRELQAEVGQEAIDTYLRENAGRLVELSAEEVGEVVMTMAGTDKTAGHVQDGGAITTAMAVHAFTDRDLPGRLFRSIKRWLGNDSLERVRVFERAYRIVALVTPVLVHLREAAADAGSGDARLYLGRPVNYEGRGASAPSEANKVAVERILESCRHAGFGTPELYPEPVAAATSFLHRERDQAERVVLAFDFGGGTLDLTVVRARGAAFEILATHGTGIGGDRIDQALYRAKVFPELGEGCTFHRPIGPDLVELPFPFRDFADRLLNWALAYELNRGDTREIILEGMREKGETRRKLGRLFELVSRNHAYRVLQGIERAKIQLSTDTQAVIDVPELDLSVPVSRDELETTIAPLIEEIGQCVDQVLAQAELAHADIDVVVRTGGSSLIPIVARLLEERFRGRVLEHDPFHSIAAGLAIASHERALPI